MPPFNRQRTHAKGGRGGIDLSPLLFNLGGGLDAPVIDKEALTQGVAKSAGDMQGPQGRVEGGEPLSGKLTYQVPLSQQTFKNPYKPSTTWQKIVGNDAANDANMKAAEEFHSLQMRNAANMEQMERTNAFERANMEFQKIKSLETSAGQHQQNIDYGAKELWASAGMLSEHFSPALSQAASAAYLGQKNKAADVGQLESEQAMATLGAMHRTPSHVEQAADLALQNQYSTEIDLQRQLQNQAALSPLKRTLAEAQTKQNIEAASRPLGDLVRPVGNRAILRNGILESNPFAAPIKGQSGPASIIKREEGRAGDDNQIITDPSLVPVFDQDLGRWVFRKPRAIQ